MPSEISEEEELAAEIRRRLRELEGGAERADEPGRLQH
jgi:hypothetical protein